jgi:hypothetical protein
MGPASYGQDTLDWAAVAVAGMVAGVRKKESVTQQQTSLLEWYLQRNT